MVHGELNVARSRARWGGRRRAICVGPRREVAAEQLLVERRERGRAGLESAARIRSTPRSRVVPRDPREHAARSVDHRAPGRSGPQARGGLPRPEDREIELSTLGGDPLVDRIVEEPDLDRIRPQRAGVPSRAHETVRVHSQRIGAIRVAARRRADPGATAFEEHAASDSPRIPDPQQGHRTQRPRLGDEAQAIQMRHAGERAARDAGRSEVARQHHQDFAGGDDLPAAHDGDAVARRHGDRVLRRDIDAVRERPHDPGVERAHLGLAGAGKRGREHSPRGKEGAGAGPVRPVCLRDSAPCHDGYAPPGARGAMTSTTGDDHRRSSPVSSVTRSPCAPPTRTRWNRPGSISCAPGTALEIAPIRDGRNEIAAHAPGAGQTRSRPGGHSSGRRQARVGSRAQPGRKEERT